MENAYTDGTRTAFDTESGQTVDRLSLDLDQSHTLGKGWQLTYGAGFDLARDHDWQHYTVREGDPASEDTDSSLREYTANLYAGIGRQFARVGFSLSLSGEYYRLGDYDDWALYPQASFTWMPSSDHTLQLALSSDKSYPSYWEMQRSVSYIDGYSEAHGTPGLRPAHNYSAQLTYVLRQKYVFMLYWSETSDYFQQTAYQSPDRPALIYQSHNWNLNRFVGMNAIVPFRIGQWLDSRVTLSGMRMHQRCDRFHEISFDRSKWLGIARMENTVRLAKKPDLTLDISGYYQSPAIQGTYDADPSWGVDAGAKWTFSRGRATLSVRCTDLFETTLPFAWVRYKGQHLDMDSGAYTRAFTVRLAWRFGVYKERKTDRVDTSRFGH
ncbi:outer membrane beta-barrel family protein [Alistipes sp.]|uniref:outer membrane beta-barrel family protein n=1 Tax=Alistipes sp. TaxID=1872444 RepID=UPI003AEFD1A5